jgi:hypothetical protein
VEGFPTAINTTPSSTKTHAHTDTGGNGLQQQRLAELVGKYRELMSRYVSLCVCVCMRVRAGEGGCGWYKKCACENEKAYACVRGSHEPANYYMHNTMHAHTYIYPYIHMVSRTKSFSFDPPQVELLSTVSRTK